jgi:methanogenic corrinoid protein MtbC1
MAHPNGLHEAILNGDAKKARATTEAALAAGLTPSFGLLSGMKRFMDPSRLSA